VRFTSIKATKKDKDVQVDWNIASEAGIKHYEVELSFDGIHFNKAADVAVKASNTNINYNWIDVNATLGTNYYRIRAIQADGRVILSSVVIVKIDAAKTGIVVFPNPVKNQQINFQLNTIEKGKYTLLFVNSQGQQVVKGIVDYKGGIESHVLDINNNLPKGMYYLKIINQKVTFGRSVLVE
jgi:hypothetical protein